MCNLSCSLQSVVGTLWDSLACAKVHSTHKIVLFTQFASHCTLSVITLASYMIVYRRHLSVSSHNYHLFVRSFLSQNQRLWSEKCSAGFSFFEGKQLLFSSQLALYRLEEKVLCKQASSCLG